MIQDSECTASVHFQGIDINIIVIFTDLVYTPGLRSKKIVTV